MSAKILASPYLMIPIVVLALVGGFFLGRGGNKTVTENLPTTTQQINGTAAQGEQTVPSGGTLTPSEPELEEFNIAGGEYYFSPSSITVKEGVTVKINFQNEGQVPHNLIVEGFGVGTETIEPNNTDSIEFVVPVSGTYIIYCSTGDHRASGMVGELIIE